MSFVEELAVVKIKVEDLGETHSVHSLPIEIVP